MSNNPLQPACLIAVLALLTAGNAFAHLASAQTAILHPTASPENVSRPSTRSSRDTLLNEIAGYNLPPLTYSAESIIRFTAAVQKIPIEKRKRIAEAIREFEKLDGEAAELDTLLPVRWRILASLGVYQDRDPENPSAFRKRLAFLESSHTVIQASEPLQRQGPGGGFDPAEYQIINVFTRYPGDPAAAFLVRRRLEAAPAGEDRDTLEQIFLEKFAGTPAARQYAVKKYLDEAAEPIPLPFELPHDKPAVIHFWSPTPTGAANLSILKTLAAKYPDQFALFCIPLGDPAEIKRYCERESISLSQLYLQDFPATQGITPAETPVTYLLAPGGKLAAIRYDNRLERALERLLKPAN